MEIINGLTWFNIDTSDATLGFGGPQFVYKVVDIGDWNMDTTSSVGVAHGLSSFEWKTIIDMKIIIRDDSSSYKASDKVNGVYNSVINSTSINLSRVTGGNYDTTSFSNTGGWNRGKVVFKYRPYIPSNLSGGTASISTINGESGIGVDLNGTPTTYQIKTINIGDWNMDIDNFAPMSSGLSYTTSENSSMLFMDNIIRDDTDSNRYTSKSQLTSDYIDNTSESSMFISRSNGSRFDNINFDSTTYNRGWVTVMYIPD